MVTAENPTLPKPSEINALLIVKLVVAIEVDAPVKVVCLVSKADCNKLMCPIDRPLAIIVFCLSDKDVATSLATALASNADCNKLT